MCRIIKYVCPYCYDRARENKWQKCPLYDQTDEINSCCGSYTQSRCRGSQSLQKSMVCKPCRYNGRDLHQAAQTAQRYRWPAPSPKLTAADAQVNAQLAGMPGADWYSLPRTATVWPAYYSPKAAQIQLSSRVKAQPVQDLPRLQEVSSHRPQVVYTAYNSIPQPMAATVQTTKIGRADAQRTQTDRRPPPLLQRRIPVNPQPQMQRPASKRPTASLVKPALVRPQPQALRPRTVVSRHPVPAPPRRKPTRRDSNGVSECGSEDELDRNWRTHQVSPLTPEFARLRTNAAPKRYPVPAPVPGRPRRIDSDGVSECASISSVDRNYKTWMVSPLSPEFSTSHRS